MHYFSKQLKLSSVTTWKSKYNNEMKKRVKAGETADVHSLPTRKRGKPLLLGEKLDKMLY